MMRLQVDRISVHYKAHPALLDVCLALPEAMICALVGANGAGKSTLLKALVGLVPLSAGAIRIDGLAPEQARRRQRLAYLPQAEAVDWEFPLTVAQVVMMGRYGQMNLLRIPTARDRLAMRQSLEQVELWSLRDRQIGELSGGQRKRVFLARTLAQEATVLLLDEPFSGVDQRTETLMINLLRGLRDHGATILIASHDLASLPGFCDRALLLQGSVLALGSTAAVLSHESLAEGSGRGAAGPFLRS